MAVQDPRTRFKTADYEKQKQKIPDLQSEMTPAPNCGGTSYQSHQRLQGYRILVTGGGSAIGRAVAIAYAEEGADVVINYLPSEEQDAQEVCQVIEEGGRKAVLIPGDIRDEQFNYNLVEQAYQQLGGLSSIISVAGYQQYHDDIHGFTIKAFTETLETNVHPLFWIVQKALEYLRPGAPITTTSSVQGYNPSSILYDYAAPKATIILLTKGFSEELEPKGIRMNYVVPGPFWSPLQISGEQPQNEVPTFGQKAPLGRVGQPVELCGAYMLLASEESGYTTGQVFGVSGGVQIDWVCTKLLIEQHNINLVASIH